MASLSRELVAASTRPLILTILGQDDCYGYQILQKVKDLSEGEIEWKEGMLYPLLHRLEAERLIESYWSSETGRRRRYYRLKASGRRALQAEERQWMLVHESLMKLWEGQPCPA